MTARGKRPSRLKGVVAALAGGVLLAFAAVMAYQTLRAATFRSVQGTVISKRLHSVESGPTNLHTPIIKYLYVVQGKVYRNNVFSLVDNDGTKDWATGVLQKFHVGAACTVYYDPANPQTSALSTRPASRAVWMMILSAFLGFVGLLGGILIVRGAAWPNNPIHASGEIGRGHE